MARAHYEVVVAAFFGHFTSIAFMYTSGIFIPAWQQEWPEASKAELSAAISCWNGCFMGSGLLSGRVIPKYGHRKVELFFGTLLAVAWAGASFAQQPWQLYPLMALQGVSAGHVWAAINSLIPTHFPQSRAKMAGFATSGAGVGSLVVSAMHSRLLSVMDWRGVFLVTGAIYMVIGVLVAAAMVPAPTAGMKSFQKTESMTMREVIPLPPLLKDPVFRLLALSFVILGLGFFGVMPLVDDYRKELGCSAEVRTAAYSAFGVLSIVGRLLSGALGDKFSPAAVWGGLLMIFSFITLGLAFVPSCTLFTASVGGIGLFSGPFASLFVPMVAELFGLENVPRALGYLFTVNGASGFLASVIGGRLRDVTGDYTWSFVFYAMASCIGAGNVLVNVRRIHVKRLKWRKARYLELMAAKALEAPLGEKAAEEEALRKEDPAADVLREEDVIIYTGEAKAKAMMLQKNTKEDSATNSTAAPSSNASSRRPSKERAIWTPGSQGSPVEQPTKSPALSTILDEASEPMKEGMELGKVNAALVELAKAMEEKMKVMEATLTESQAENQFLRSELSKTQAELDAGGSHSQTRSLSRSESVDPEEAPNDDPATVSAGDHAGDRPILGRTGTFACSV